MPGSGHGVERAGARQHAGMWAPGASQAVAMLQQLQRSGGGRGAGAMDRLLLAAATKVNLWASRPWFSCLRPLMLLSHLSSFSTHAGGLGGLGKYLLGTSPSAYETLQFTAYTAALSLAACSAATIKRHLELPRYSLRERVQGEEPGASTRSQRAADAGCGIVRTRVRSYPRSAHVCSMASTPGGFGSRAMTQSMLRSGKPTVMWL
jgi:hypothetical protein